MKSIHKLTLFFIALLLTTVTIGSALVPQTGKAQSTGSYPIVDTGQTACYDASGAETACPAEGEAFYGQDAQFTGNTASYTDNGDGTVTDNVTGLIWQQTTDTDGDGDIDTADKLSYTAAGTYCENLSLAGADDWQLPTIKQLYSLIDFSGFDISGYEGTDTSGLVPFIDTDYFDFAYGDTNAGERLIDSQYASSTLYLSNLDIPLLFGVNFADGRIKGYGLELMGQDKTFSVLCVRENSSVGVNNFTDNGNGTITDHATELMWAQNDSGSDAPDGLNWEEALAYVETQNDANYLGYSNWRLPNVKELQSIVDYSRSPDMTNSAAIDPLFNTTSITNEAGETDYDFYWSSTTHANWTVQPGRWGAYVSFGRSLGYMNGVWSDQHGAGSQRSDPKEGDPADYPTGNGPQGDAVRIYNTVRLVRDADPSGATATPSATSSPVTATPSATSSPVTATPSATSTTVTATPITTLDYQVYLPLILVYQDSVSAAPTATSTSTLTTPTVTATPSDVDGLDTTLFFDGALAEEISIQDCTLSDGTETTCYQMTIAGYPANHDVGPFCPETTSDTAENGGIWFDGNGVYDLTGAFILALADLYNDNHWKLYDDDGNVNVTDTKEAFEAAARPDVDPAYQNHCVEGRIEWLDNGEPVPTTVLIPTNPIDGTSATVANGNLGITLNGVIIANSAPVDAILNAYTIAAFDDCGGHINPFDGYHLHGARGCSEVGEAVDGETPIFAYALDGYAIHSPLAEADEAAAGLDACQGHTTEADGYHYHAASVEQNAILSCFTGMTVESTGGGPPPGGHAPQGGAAGTQMTIPFIRSINSILNALKGIRMP